MRNRILYVLVGLLATTAAAQAFYEPGDEVEDFTLPDPSGEPVSLSDFAGDVVLINFFATW